jgi:hypothetical protein
MSRLRVFHFSRLWGHAGVTVVNMYPLRSPQPVECRRWGERAGNRRTWRECVQKNANEIAEHARRASNVVVAWGNMATDRAWIGEVADGLGETPIYCLGVTRKGKPKRPMGRGSYRVPDDQEPVLWFSGWLRL